MSFPALTVLITRWCPPLERSRANAFIKSGSMFGVFLVMPTAGFLITAFGWESVFYVTGAVAVLWSILLEFLVYDDPQTHPRILERERSFLSESIGAHNLGEKNRMK
ncbi:unnamed protein product, partial [Notodromas monacha]